MANGGGAKAPYRFIPIGSKVVPGPVAFEQISHGRPLEGGWSGHMDVEWTAQTPICVGQPDAQGASKPFRVGEGGEHALPGSSLKGMLRSVMEIATFSHLGKINAHHHFGYRDFNDQKYYREKITTNELKAGWLSRGSNGWVFRQARDDGMFFTLPIHDLIEHVCNKNSMATLSREEKLNLISCIICNSKNEQAWKKFIADMQNNDIEKKRESVDFSIKSVAEPHRGIIFDRMMKITANGNVPPKVIEHVCSNLTLDCRLYHNTLGLIQNWLRSSSSQEIELNDIALSFLSNLTINWKTLPLMSKRYLLRKCPTIGGERCDYDGKVLSRRRHDSNNTGYIVCSDKAMANGNKRTEAFFKPPAVETISIDPKTMESFAKLHSKFGKNHWIPEGMWAYWLREFGYPDPLATGASSAPGTAARELTMPGIPIFYCGELAQINDTENFFMGFSRVIKIPYRQSVGQIAAHTAGLDKGGPYRVPPLAQDLDFARAIFGDVEGEETLKEKKDRQALKGRVAFEFAYATPNTFKETELASTVMMGPRASYWPFYLKDGQDPSRSANYNNDLAILAGRKRYPIRTKEVSLPPLQGASFEQTTTVSFLHPANGQNPTFTGRICFHNLHPAELGALLWALCLGDYTFGQAGYSHALGRAKAFGYGRLTCAINSFKTTENFTENTCTQPNNALRFLEEFTRYMDEKLSSLGYKFSFQQAPAVRALQSMADPKIGDKLGSSLGYMELKYHQKNKKDSITLGYLSQKPQDWKEMRPE